MDGSCALGAKIRNTTWEAALLLVLPLAFWHGFAEPFSTPKSFLTKVLVIAGLALWGLEAIWRVRRPRSSCALTIPVVAFGVTILGSCLMGPAPRFSLMEAIYGLCGPGWLLLLVSWEKGSQGVRRILAFVGIAGGLVAAIALLQRIGFDPILIGGYRVNWESMVARMRLYSTFGNPNFVGGYLIGAIFAALALAATARTRRAKVGWPCVASLMLVAIILTGSHGAWLGLTVGAIAASLIGLSRPGKRPVTVSEKVSGSSFPSVAACILCLPTVLVTFPFAEHIAAQLQGRVYLWRFSWPAFFQHPLVGSGWGSYQLLYLDLQGRFLASHSEYLGYWTNNRFVHNDALQLLLETGLLGLGAFIWILWSYRQTAAKVMRESPDAWPRIAVATSVGSVTAILTDAIFNYQFAVAPTYMLLFTLLAIPSLLIDRQSQEGSDRQVLHVNRTPKWQSIARVAASALLLAATGVLLLQQTHILESERDYQRAFEMESRNEIANAEVAYRHCVNLNDLNGRAHFGLSRVLFSIRRSREALLEIAKAERTYADSHQELLHGQILEQLGRNSEAIDAYHHAAWLDPGLTDAYNDAARLQHAKAEAN